LALLSLLATMTVRLAPNLLPIITSNHIPISESPSEASDQTGPPPLGLQIELSPTLPHIFIDQIAENRNSWLESNAPRIAPKDSIDEFPPTKICIELHVASTLAQPFGDLGRRKIVEPNAFALGGKPC
jgi:hypothetical protein